MVPHPPQAHRESPIEGTEPSLPHGVEVVPKLDSSEGSVEVGRIAESIGLSRQVVLELLALFVTTSRADLTRIEQAIGKGNLAEVSETAHSLKGAALNFEFYDIASAARDLETAARLRALGDASGSLEHIHDRVETIARSIGFGDGASGPVTFSREDINGART